MEYPKYFPKQWNWTYSWQLKNTYEVVLETKIWPFFTDRGFFNYSI